VPRSYFTYDGEVHDCVSGDHVVNLFSFSKAFGMMVCHSLSSVMFWPTSWAYEVSNNEFESLYAYSAHVLLCDVAGLPSGLHSLPAG